MRLSRYASGDSDGKIVGLEDTKKEGMSSHPLGAHRECTYSITG